MTRPAANSRAVANPAAALRTIRCCYGALQLARPGLVASRLLVDPLDERARRIARLLGVRQLTQALVSGTNPSYPVLALGVEVDVAHAASMLALALADRRRRRVALTDALLAGSFALAGAAVAYMTPRPLALPAAASGLGRMREKWADRLARLSVPGYPPRSPR